VEIGGTFPAGVIGKTSENLAAAAAGERNEWSEIYPGFASIAKSEGFDAISKAFESISVAEKQHMKRYLDLKANIDAGRVFKRDKAQIWRCRNCGYLHAGNGAPDKCPACEHPKAHFEILGENW